MHIDIIAKKDPTIINELEKLDFNKIFYTENGVIRSATDTKPFDLKLYSGKDYDFVITKGKANAITDFDKNEFLLNKGLCSKLKENEIFVLFKFKSLIESKDFFRTYKNFVINSRLCNECGVPALYVSFAENLDDVKSPIQLVAFSENFGYKYINYKKAVDLISKRS